MGENSEIISKGYLSPFQAVEAAVKNLRTIVMCTTGVGTAALLKLKLEKKFPELEIVTVISSRKITDVLKKYKNIDLIVSTVRIKESINIPVIVVSAMFNAEDQKNLEMKLKELLYV